MSSEGVGSYWPFATGRRVDQANLILEQIVATPAVDCILVPNQHIGAWEVSFMPQWITREYLARRNGAKFSEDQVEKQPEVGVEAYDKGAEILREFFLRELAQFDSPDLLPLGKEIIECCVNGGTAADYDKLLGNGTLKPSKK